MISLKGIFAVKLFLQRRPTPTLIHEGNRKTSNKKYIIQKCILDATNVVPTTQNKSHEGDTPKKLNESDTTTKSHEGDTIKQMARRWYNKINRTKVIQQNKLHEGDATKQVAWTG
jgi:hypothetical protein